MTKIDQMLKTQTPQGKAHLQARAPQGGLGLKHMLMGIMLFLFIPGVCRPAKGEKHRVY